MSKALEHKITIGENGRILIPSKIRKLLNIMSGDRMMLVVDNGLRIVPLKDVIRKHKEFIKSRNKDNISLTKSLKESRLEEFANE